MRAAVYHGRQDLRLEDVPEPEPKAGEVKLRVLYNGICGSDLQEYFDGPIISRVSPHPLTGVKNPVIMGHELCGEVVELGRGVKDLKEGDLVAVEPFETCGKCIHCKSGQYNHCKLLAFHGYNRAGGGLGEYTTVRRQMAHKLPAGLTAQQGALIEPMAIAWRTAERCRVESGQTVAIHGGGPIGIGVYYTLARRGVRVIMFDISPVAGVPYDTPILGYRVNTANTLRLWRAEAPESFDFSVFNRGDYLGAVQQKMLSENLSKVLYPNDETLAGKELRLQQQYFFVACSLADMLRILKVQSIPLDRLHEKFAVQLNDTHPAIAVAELMRLLVDEHGMGWEQAWGITTRTLAYTNHTLLPEALECWSLPVFGKVLPRHLEIIFEINARFLEEVRGRFPDDPGRIARMSLIDERGERAVRMAHLAVVGSHAVNGVADLHTQLLKQSVLKDFHELWPAKISNKTNGVTPRRWLALTNPGLTRIISDAIGDGWLRDLSQLTALKRLKDDAGFQRSWSDIKRRNKTELARLVRERSGISMDPQAMLDVQVKRIHEYKRQHLNLLHIISLYLRLTSERHFEMTPRTFLFSGKAAPGYRLAKLIIQLAHGVAEVVNHDRRTEGHLRVVFLPNFSVSSGQRIYPAAELSEQISTAGKEASGTGNMKMCMNGALTIGTLDGANIEISREVGPDNCFLFGLSAADVEALHERGYRPADTLEDDPLLAESLSMISRGVFSKGDMGAFKPLVDSLMWSDPFMVLADFRAYLECQSKVGAAYKDARAWNRMSITNVAHSGLFSSDRTIREYAREIWRVSRVPIRMLARDELSYGIAREER